MNKIFVSPKDAAEALGISLNKVYQLLRGGELKAAKLGRDRTVIKYSDVEAYADKLLQKNDWLKTASHTPVAAGGGRKAA